MNNKVMIGTVGVRVTEKELAESFAAGLKELSDAVYESAEETRQRKEEAMIIERDLGLALAPLLRFAVQTGHLTGDFMDVTFNERLWDICEQVSEIFESDLISPRLVKRYVLNNKSPLIWQSGKLAQLELFDMTVIIQEEKQYLKRKAELARRF